jgi:hypothetical protein
VNRTGKGREKRLGRAAQERRTCILENGTVPDATQVRSGRYLVRTPALRYWAAVERSSQKGTFTSIGQCGAGRWHHCGLGVQAQRYRSVGTLGVVEFAGDGESCKSSDAAEDPPQVEAPVDNGGLCDSTGSLFAGAGFILCQLDWLPCDPSPLSRVRVPASQCATRTCILDKPIGHRS